MICVMTIYIYTKYWFCMAQKYLLPIIFYYRSFIYVQRKQKIWMSLEIFCDRRLFILLFSFSLIWNLIEWCIFNSCGCFWGALQRLDQTDPMMMMIVWSRYKYLNKMCDFQRQDKIPKLKISLFFGLEGTTVKNKIVFVLKFWFTVRTYKNWMDNVQVELMFIKIPSSHSWLDRRMFSTKKNQKIYNETSTLLLLLQ